MRGRPDGPRSGRSRRFGKYAELGAYHWDWADRSSPLYAPAAEARYALVAERVRGRGRVLDIGCGDGFLLGLVASGGSRAVGVDPEVSGVALARAKLADTPAAAVLVASGAGLPFPDGSFDAVVMAEVVEHLEDPDATLREARRVLRDGGRMVVTTPRRLPDRWWDRANHVKEYRSEELRSLLAAHFDTVEVTHFLSLRWWAVRKRLGKVFIRLWSRFLFNPFTREGPEPERFGHLLAVAEVSGTEAPAP